MISVRPLLIQGHTDFNMIAMRANRSWSICRLVEKTISAGISTVLQSTAFASSVVGLLSGAKEATASLLSFAAIRLRKVGKIEDNLLCVTCGLQSFA